jgi:hypothetical protein
MKPAECLREHEVMEIVGCGRWPNRCAEELRAHVASCEICSDVLEIAIAFHEDRETQAAVQVPSPGLVWWRAELRARQEAMRVVSRPMTLVQALGAAAGIGAAVALLSQAWPLLKTLFAFPDVSALSFSQWGIVIVIAVAVIVIAPVAMYLALSDE